VASSSRAASAQRAPSSGSLPSWSAKVLADSQLFTTERREQYLQVQWCRYRYRLKIKISAKESIHRPLCLTCCQGKGNEAFSRIAIGSASSCLSSLSSLSHPTADQEFLDEFLMGYRYFMTPHNLLDNLVQRCTSWPCSLCLLLSFCCFRTFFFLLWR
jgi:hypothetical protein